MAYWVNGQAVDDYDFDAHDLLFVGEEHGMEFAVATPKGAKEDKVDLRELGGTSTSPWLDWLRVDYNPDLRGQAGLRNYDKMRRNDGTVRGTLRLIKTPILSARWYVQPATQSTRDKNAAQFIENCLFKYMSTSFPQFLTEALLMLDYGYYPFEKVFRIDHPDAPGKVVWKKLAPRHPLDVLTWNYDENGGPDGIEVPNPREPTTSFNTSIPIPIDKLLVFTFDREAGNIEGMSVLRSAYKHWYYKEQLYKIDAIQKERHGIGIPIIVLPPNFTKGDKDLAEKIGRNLRTNERAHVVLPPNWDINFAKLEGQHVDALKSADHHDGQIRANILGEWMKMGGSDEQQGVFLKSTRYIADIITDVFNKYAIPQLIDYNFSRVGYPELRARRIGESADWRTLSFAVRNMVGSGIIVPDDPLEDAMREEMDLPERDPETARIVKTPQNPNEVPAPPSETPSPTGDGSTGALPNTPPSPPTAPNRPAPPGPPRVGAPRQAVRPPLGPGRTNSGIDRSGG
jgi:hypothetical protein